MQLPDLENGRDAADADRWRRLLPALVFSGVLHSVLLVVSVPSEPEPPPDSILEVNLEYVPRPVAETFVEETPPVLPATRETEPVETATVEPALPGVADTQAPVAGDPASPAATDTVVTAVATEPSRETDETAPTTPPSPLDDPDLVTRLLAAPLAPNPPPGPFDAPIDAPVTPDPAPDEFRIPERKSMIAMLSPPLPDLPFADPGLDVFMYAPGWQGDLHRGFDNISPEFGWRTKTGLVVRCRWVLVVVGCGWGRSRYSPGIDRARKAAEKE